jgi:hypothetical protein
MTDLNFDLNIHNYSNVELKKIFFIENNYNIDILKTKINILKTKIFSLQLSKKEKSEFNIFFNKVELKLIKYLEKEKTKNIQEELNNKIIKWKKQSGE